MVREIIRRAGEYKCLWGIDLPSRSNGASVVVGAEVDKRPTLLVISNAKTASASTQSMHADICNSLTKVQWDVQIRFPPK